MNITTTSLIDTLHSVDKRLKARRKVAMCSLHWPTLLWNVPSFLIPTGCQELFALAHSSLGTDFNKPLLSHPYSHLSELYNSLLHQQRGTKASQPLLAATSIQVSMSYNREARGRGISAEICQVKSKQKKRGRRRTVWKCNDDQVEEIGYKG